MADLFITEYVDVPTYFGAQILSVGVEPALAEQAVTIGAGSAQSAELNGKTRFVRLHAEAACAIAFGASPTAVATLHRMPAGAVEFYGVNPKDDTGNGIKIAVIMDS